MAGDEEAMEDVAEEKHGFPSSPDDIREMDIDEIFGNTGSNSRFQLTLYICMFYVILTTTWNFILSMFTGNEPSWKCINNSSNIFCQIHGNEIIHSYSEHFHEKCRMNESDWTFTTSKGYSYVTEFELICDRTYLAALVSSSYYIGGFLGSTFSGTIADLYGRKPVLLGSLVILICSSIGCSYAKNIWQLIGVNIARGASSAANYYTVFVYLSEFCVPEKRTFSACLLLFAGPSSFLLLDLIAYLERNWRKLQLYTAILPTLGIIVFSLLPESPRWSLASGRPTQAMSTLEKINKYNRVSTIKQLRLKIPKTSEEEKYTYIDLVRNVKVFTLTCSVATLWFAITLVFYTITLASPNLGGDMYKTFALSTQADIMACIACANLCNRIGRKRVILGGLCISGLLMGSMLLVPKSSASRYTINVVLSTIARFTACTAFDGMFTWTFELYPTVVRSQGMSVSVVFERLGMFCCPFITRVLQNVNPALPLIIMFALAILASLFGLVLPETNRKPTRERYEDFFEFEVTNIELGKVNKIDGYIEGGEECT